VIRAATKGDRERIEALLGSAQLTSADTIDGYVADVRNVVSTIESKSSSENRLRRHG
jgi:hypothetical protein